MAVREQVGRRLNDFAYSFSAKNRDRKWQTFASLFPGFATLSILDVGFNPGGAAETENYLEKHHPDPSRITALTIEDVGDAAARYPGVQIVKYDGDRIPFEDDTFDIVWSNAVVEHVGDRASQVAFVAELDRIAKHHFVTTPNRWFPFEVHTKLPVIHYLPKPWFDRAITKMGKGWAAGDYMQLLSRRQFESVLGAAMVPSYRIITNHVFGFPLDYVAVW